MAVQVYMRLNNWRTSEVIFMVYLEKDPPLAEDSGSYTEWLLNMKIHYEGCLKEATDRITLMEEKLGVGDKPMAQDLVSDINTHALKKKEPLWK